GEFQIMNIALCGMMGVGKTSVGIELAKLLNRPWYDTDSLIVDRYGKISDLFEFYGEEHFRRLEAGITRELAKQDNIIISTGGGLVIRLENNVALHENGVIVYLRARLDTLMKRVQINDQRPLLKQQDAENRMRELLAQRNPIYRSVSDYVIDTDDMTPAEVAQEIVAKLKGSRTKKKEQ
ncbi:MAG: shikimate kinase, partial [Christensenellaceae bacterium]